MQIMQKNIKKELDRIITELSFKDNEYLTPEEFYNLIVAAWEINGS